MATLKGLVTSPLLFFTFCEHALGSWACDLVC